MARLGGFNTYDQLARMTEVEIVSFKSFNGCYLEF